MYPLLSFSSVFYNQFPQKIVFRRQGGRWKAKCLHSARQTFDLASLAILEVNVYLREGCRLKLFFRWPLEMMGIVMFCIHKSLVTNEGDHTCSACRNCLKCRIIHHWGKENAKAIWYSIRVYWRIWKADQNKTIKNIYDISTWLLFLLFSMRTT